MNSALVSLRGVGVRFGPTPVLTGIDLDLAQGEAIGVTGPNGAGKSTLLSLIAGEVTPSAGLLTFENSVGLILGANIGATVTPLITALDLDAVGLQQRAGANAGQLKDLRRADGTG